MNELEVSEMKDVKPKLIWVGRLLGMDLYADYHLMRNPEQKVKIATKLLADFKPTPVAPESLEARE